MKTYIENLCFIVNNDCNLDCAHCLRGKKRKEQISEEVIKTTLDQVDVIKTLGICGGEPTMSVPKIEEIFSYIMDNHIVLSEVTLTINGTIYSSELLRLLKEISDYIKKDEQRSFLAISYDKYHLNEISKLGLMKQFAENVLKYREDKSFYALRELNPKLKLFREGNASELDENLTTPLKPFPHIMSYRNSRVINGEKVCLIGPVVCVNPKGYVTDCDASIINQESNYNYGNVLERRIEDICSDRAEIVPALRFNSTCKKLVKQYDTYND